MILSAVRKFLTGVLRHLGFAPRYRAIAIVDMPEKVDSGILYVIGEAGRYWQAAFECPCGCGQTIQVPLTQDAHPRWIMQGAMSHPTLTPSVHRTFGCKSHFFLRKGQIIWCR